MTAAKVQLHKKNTLIMSLKRLGGTTNILDINLQL
jgi:hypothetical protein